MLSCPALPVDGWLAGGGPAGQGLACSFGWPPSRLGIVMEPGLWPDPGRRRVVEGSSARARRQWRARRRWGLRDDLDEKVWERGVRDRISVEAVSAGAGEDICNGTPRNAQL